MSALKNKILFSVLLLAFTLPVTLYSQDFSLAHQRAGQLGSGINTDRWLEAYWDASYPVTGEFTEQDFILMHDWGFRHVRLPVVFNRWVDTIPPYNIDTAVFSIIDTVFSWCDKNDLKLILCNHHGHLETAGVTAELPRLVATWEHIANWYKNISPEKIFFELYNEPNIDAGDWKNTAQLLCDTIRKITTGHTIVVGAHSGSTVWGYGFYFGNGFTPVNDTNVIYTFHYYEPALFTHQGAPWANTWGNCFNVTGFPFEYDSLLMPLPDTGILNNQICNLLYNNYPVMATSNWIDSSLAFVRNWADSFHVPIYCGEFGAYYIAGFNDRVKWLNNVSCSLDSLNIPWSHWGWKRAEDGFGFINGSVGSADSLISPMLNAFCFYEPPPLEVEPLPVSDYISGFSIFPNPAVNSFSVIFSCSQSGVVSMEIDNILGIPVLNVRPFKIKEGQHLYEIIFSDFSITPGLYFLKLFFNETTFLHTIVKG